MARLPSQPRDLKLKLPLKVDSKQIPVWLVLEVIVGFEIGRGICDSPYYFTALQISNMANNDTPNPLISTQKSSDTSLQVALHPLVLLTISDYITRHTLRQQKGSVVGALLGQQNGREITIEHAFDCLLRETKGETVLDEAWFDLRLQQSEFIMTDLKNDQC